MFSKITMTVATLLIGAMAHADMMGVWNGDLAYTIDAQAQEACVSQFSYQQDGDVLTFTQNFSGGACTFSTQVQLLVNGSDLTFEDGTVVGKISDESISFALPELQGEGYEATITMNADGTAQFSDKYVYSGSEETLTGTMTRAR